MKLRYKIAIGVVVACAAALAIISVIHRASTESPEDRANAIVRYSIPEDTGVIALKVSEFGSVPEKALNKNQLCVIHDVQHAKGIWCEPDAEGMCTLRHLPIGEGYIFVAVCNGYFPEMWPSLEQVVLPNSYKPVTHEFRLVRL